MTDSLEGGGGAERRFVRMFRFMREERGFSDFSLITHTALLPSLGRASILVDSSAVIIINKEPLISRDSNFFSRYIHHIRCSVRYYLTFRGLLSQHQFDVLHFLSPNLYFMPFIFFSRKRVRFIFSMVAPTQWHRDFSRKGRFIWKLWYRMAHVIDSLYSSFPEVYPEFRAKTRVTPCSFTDYERFFPAEEKERWIIFAGRMSPEKNPMLFLEAIVTIADVLRQSGWKVIMLGKGPLEAAVRDSIESRSLGDIISLRALPDVSEVVNRSSIFVSIQRGENYPSQSLLEAMAAGNAVIATDVGQTRRLVNGENGVLLEDGSAEAVGRALANLIDDEEKRKNMGKSARESIVGAHRVDIFADYIERLWAEVCGDTYRRKS